MNSGPSPIGSVGSTVELFSNRLTRKLKEQEVKTDQSQKQCEARQALILQAMNMMRKALSETAKINLGNRFSFDLDVSDWEGWPRVELNLVDSVAPERVDYALIVTAHDRQDLGCIQMSMRSGQVLGKVHLQDPGQFERLPLILKRGVRHFLDAVAPYVLNPPKPEDMLEVQTKALVPEESEGRDLISNQLSQADVFMEDERNDGNLVAVADVAPVEIN